METIKKWLLSYETRNELKIDELEVNKYIPINRFLDQVGFYSFDVLKVYGIHYLCVYDSKLPKQAQDKVLVAKIAKTEKGEGLIDLETSDKKNMAKIAQFFLKDSKFMVQ